MSKPLADTFRTNELKTVQTQVSRDLFERAESLAAIMNLPVSAVVHLGLKRVVVDLEELYKAELREFEAAHRGDD